MSNEVKPFLTRFQTSKLLSPLLYEICYSVLRYLLKQIVKLDIDEKTTSQIMEINLENQEVLLVVKKLSWDSQLNESWNNSAWINNLSDYLS
jgi:hypothetical protein